MVQNGQTKTAGKENGKKASTETSDSKRGLSAADARSLAELEKKMQLVRDRVTGVALGYTTGFVLDGPGGVSKSFTVLQTLQQLQANFRVSNSRMTGRGLFDTLAMYPDCVHVIEDVESMMNDKMAVGVLRSVPEANLAV